MTEPAARTETRVAAGVPYVVRHPSAPRSDAPAVVAWHLLDAPRTPAAFAAALPLAGFDGWRVYPGLPMSGAHSLEPEEVARRVAADPVLQAHEPLNAQAVAEFPAAWNEVRATFGIGAGRSGCWAARPVEGCPGAVALSGAVDVAALVLVLVSRRAAQPVLEQLQGRLAHPLADEPGAAPAPQWELAREINRFASEWLARHATCQGTRTCSACPLWWASSRRTCSYTRRRARSGDRSRRQVGQRLPGGRAREAVGGDDGVDAVGVLGPERLLRGADEAERATGPR